MAPRVFFITGTSTGFGEELVKIALAKGDHVVATARNSKKLSFDNTSDSNYLAVDLDVTDKKSIDAGFDAALKKFKKIDVVVNNAGYGLSGPFETYTNEQIRTQFEVNFFGLLDVTRRALEVLREGGGGVIQQVTSIGGQVGVPNFTSYCATKWAIEGFTEALSKEIKPEWNIHLTCIEPGGFRTDWSGRSMKFGEIDHPAYKHINAKENAAKRDQTQPGDPHKAAIGYYELATMKDPPLRCVLGTDAYEVINKKLETYQSEVKKYEKLSTSTDVDGYQQEQANKKW